MFLQLKDDIEISVTPFNVITLIEGVKMRDPRNTLSMKIENTLSMRCVAAVVCVSWNVRAQSKPKGGILSFVMIST